MISTKRRDSLIAAIVTFLTIALVIVWLLLTTLRYNEKTEGHAEFPMLEEDEIFLDPELLIDNKQSIGEPDAVANENPAAEIQGMPVPAQTEQTHTVVSGDQMTPAPNQTLISSAEESPMETAASEKKKEEAKVAASMEGKFNMKPGAIKGKFDSTGGSDGESAGVVGKMNGRQFLGCPLPDVTLAHKTTVTVSITVDDAGKVMTATASGAASREIRKKCEAAAMQAKWSAKKGAPSTRGSITFTIIPK